MKGAVGVGGAVGSNEKITAVKVGRVNRSELDLNRPLAQFTGDISSGGGGFRPADGPALTAGTAAGQGRVRGPGRLGGQDRRMVVGGGLTLLKGDGPGGAGGQAVPQPVAVVLPGETGLAVDHLNGALVAGGGAQAAAVAPGFLDMNDSAFHGKTPPSSVSGPILVCCRCNKKEKTCAVTDSARWMEHNQSRRYCFTSSCSSSSRSSLRIRARALL